MYPFDTFRERVSKKYGESMYLFDTLLVDR
jgi:hypothetical protein